MCIVALIYLIRIHKIPLIFSVNIKNKNYDIVLKRKDNNIKLPQRKKFHKENDVNCIIFAERDKLKNIIEAERNRNINFAEWTWNYRKNVILYALEINGLIMVNAN